jgi:hypothetical protein
VIANSAASDISRAQEEWARKYHEARVLMEERCRIPSVLIEVAAQHPLVGGLYPNAEFRARLDRAVQVYGEYRSRGMSAEFYVPGSRHVDEGLPDKVSLSHAGLEYLLKQGIPSEQLHGDDLNDRYKGDDGVYGSADECFVAASYFKDQGFGSLATVLSPVQLPRKMVHYIHFGVIPLAFTAPTDDPYHDLVHELFVALPHALLVDGAAQGPESDLARALRATRRPLVEHQAGRGEDVIGRPRPGPHPGGDAADQRRAQPAPVG